MDVCLVIGVYYIDIVNYEVEDMEDFEWCVIYEKCCKEFGFIVYFDYLW